MTPPMKNELADLRSGMKLQIAGRYAEAEQIYRRVLEGNPESHDALHLLGLIRAESDRDEEGIRLIESAIQKQPNAAAFHHNLAGIYRRNGRLKEAEAKFREAIRLKQDYGEAYQGLAEMVTFEAGDPLLDQIKEQLATSSISASQASYLHFAAGKVLDDQTEYSAAFEHYQQGNKAAKRKFSTSEFRQQTKDSLYQFSPALVDKLSAGGSDSRQPFFVVGMPRSGTSLVEQILASHSSVYGAGELNDMKFIARDGMHLTRSSSYYPKFVSKLSLQQLGVLANDYLDRTRRADFAHVVDKHPLNFVFLGLVLLLFPHAKVIHTTRHPLDTCLSCYFQNFTKGQDYSFDLETLGEFYLDYLRLMDHWHQLFPGRILNVVYEDLLGDIEGQTKRMLEYCELDFEPECLSFYENQRAVKTASFMQVRQPIYQTSKGRWHNYESQLAPLAKKLGIVAIPTETPITISTLGRLF
jgi:tetratricopeptide (TPR) repeat protein